MNNRVDTRYDIKGEQIELGDIAINRYTNETVIITNGQNKTGIKGLGVENPVLGINDWLDVYPNGTFQIIGNIDDYDK
ncbi:hypothetical protein CO218_03455 [Lactiplantibacillus plantarum]|uniref:hypothetical protein n=1 Tax=Lactiplantibacillus plantarum TaxID=1590 RepID=UPI0007B56262|nr:hypothetical protein [Lactiplantibacillus plantarum]ASZ32896.1 hypothetical protein CLC99_06240 [Lactiplantibacillus plantarum]AWI40680.1 hypothetical protein LpLQ80_09135 [Lactiplantibacillus plantarum]AYE58278.1 hypothetical protein CO218_03455 [Lactiplantibacillus plantarum]QBJ55958.1 hypothetical protein C3O83_08180 [Lactiplantibacillus plantarum]QGX68153.1 hypothetical protein GPK32_04050 [Lactiplantibacillus plantarum]